MLDKIKRIRQQSGAGVVEIKKALEEASGDETRAIEILRIRGQEKAINKSQRLAQEGLIISYVHSNGRVGAMVKLMAETDFVARNEEFRKLGLDIAMHITAMNPGFIRPEDVPIEIIAKEKEIWAAQMESEKKSKEIMDKIFEGKEKKFREESALLTQSFVKNPDQTVGGLINEVITKTGENIQVGEFCRLEL